MCVTFHHSYRVPNYFDFDFDFDFHVHFVVDCLMQVFLSVQRDSHSDSISYIYQESSEE